MGVTLYILGLWPRRWCTQTWGRATATGTSTLTTWRVTGSWTSTWPRRCAAAPTTLAVPGTGPASSVPCPAPVSESPRFSYACSPTFSEPRHNFCIKKNPMAHPQPECYKITLFRLIMTMWTLHVLLSLNPVQMHTNLLSCKLGVEFFLKCSHSSLRTVQWNWIIFHGTPDLLCMFTEKAQAISENCALLTPPQMNLQSCAAVGGRDITSTSPPEESSVKISTSLNFQRKLKT